MPITQACDTVHYIVRYSENSDNKTRPICRYDICMLIQENNTE